VYILYAAKNSFPKLVQQRQMKSARFKTRSKECHNYYWHTNDCVLIEMYLILIKFN